MKLTLVTPTCDRPEAFALCERWMKAQTEAWHQWLVLDDGAVPATCTCSQDHILTPDTSGESSLNKKLSRALASGVITGDALVVIEDDDWYHPRYLESVLVWMSTGSVLVGEGNALYYNIRNGFWHNNMNNRHASLCSTAVHRSAFKTFQGVIAGNPFIDLRLWRETNLSPRHLCCPTPMQQPLVVGIKGMPGKKGYGLGHQLAHGTHDKMGDKLKWLVGEEAANEYRKYLSC